MMQFVFEVVFVFVLWSWCATVLWSWCATVVLVLSVLHAIPMEWFGWAGDVVAFWSRESRKALKMKPMPTDGVWDGREAIEEFKTSIAKALKEMPSLPEPCMVTQPEFDLVMQPPWAEKKEAAASEPAEESASIRRVRHESALLAAWSGPVKTPEQMHSNPFAELSLKQEIQVWDFQEEEWMELDTAGPAFVGTWCLVNVAMSSDMVGHAEFACIDEAQATMRIQFSVAHLPLFREPGPLWGMALRVMRMPGGGCRLSFSPQNYGDS